MIYFTADLHLGHENIIKMTGRPFCSVEEMDSVLIDNWNRKVKGNDTVFIAGDLIYKSQNPCRYLDALKGKKVLIRGNHDDGWLKDARANDYFDRIEMLIEQSMTGKMITLCHYPMLEWRGSRKVGSSKLGYLIHGHIHNSKEKEGYNYLFRLPNALNAGVDINNYEPVTFQELYDNNMKYKRSFLLGEDMDILDRREKELIF